MKIVDIEPVEGRTVRDPATGLQVTGRTPVDEDNGFWNRRIADGDVVKVSQPKAGKQESK